MPHLTRRANHRHIDNIENYIARAVIRQRAFSFVRREHAKIRFRFAAIDLPLFQQI
jgi:hypothetical protein